MRFFYACCFSLLVMLMPFYGFGYQNVTLADSTEVIKLTTKAYKSRLSDAEQTVRVAEQALKLAKQIDYKFGIAEAYRIKGIGLSYQYEPVLAYDAYISALTYFQAIDNKSGKARVYNNIGNLYRETDYDAAMKYFQLALPIAINLKQTGLIASIYLNEGNVLLRQKSYYRALFLFEKSRAIFEQLKDDVNEMNCKQNIGVTYFNLNEFNKAQDLLLQAHEIASKLQLNSSIAQIDLTLAAIYIAQNKFADAEKAIAEGQAFAQNKKVESDFMYTSYELEVKRKDYQRALAYLSHIYHQDSLEYRNLESKRIELHDAQHKKEASEREKERAEEMQKNTRYLFIAAAVAALLLVVVIILLMANVKRKAETNKRLTELNGEVYKQKDDLDRINHHLEEIIDERTKDLQVKNKKLAEYSSYLSHQIRGPIATLKGLMNLEKEGLVDKGECIDMMNKCVSEIDEKIIDVSDMLHDTNRSGFKV